VTPLIEEAARTSGLNVDFVTAIVLVESAGDPFAWNPEPRYRALWNVRTKAPFRALTDAEIASEVPPVDFPYLLGGRDQEWWAQQASWGLMQIMGAVAREEGFAPALPAGADRSRGEPQGRLPASAPPGALGERGSRASGGRL
jgi:hypothetical protein